jgi:hypothetical protein
VTTVLNDEFYPVLLMGFDEPYAPGELEHYLEKLAGICNEAIRTRRRHVVIVVNDPRKVSAAGRRRVADAMALHLTTEQVNVTLASFLPIDSTIVRGALTAFRWFSPNTLKTLVVTTTMEEALDEALKALAVHGTPFTGERQALRRALRLTG